MLIVLSSATSAQRLKKMLDAKKIPSRIVQTPKHLSDGGCSYSLKFDKAHLNQVSSLVSTLHISVIKIEKEDD
ncbi:MAG: DUF3343 domain-containing protein [Clostridia bacterium]|nr:DUF3343 domain-containing protein [Clostridia bacterium]